MELTLRLHRYLREKGQPYRITFVADPICWTEAPEDLRALANQRIRWQRGLAESLVMNYKLMTSGRGGVVGWFAFPFHVIFEFLGPVVEITGLAFIIIAYWFGWLSLESFAAFMFVAIGMGILLSTSALVFEAMSFRVYPRLFQSFRLFLMSIAENLGYRQLNSIWRIIGMIGWALGTKPTWGEMRASSKLGKKAGSV
jgi:cellulose synthase/poly-beta-1,6-N-acetylglucosamine synthase-like glycosyltransferase